MLGRILIALFLSSAAPHFQLRDALGGTHNASEWAAHKAVQADPSVREADVAKYAKDYRYTFPLLLDPQQILVRHANATITPQVAILSPEGKVVYLGPIDNRVVDFGKARPRATESYVREDLDAILAGKPVPVTTQHSVGCSIPRNIK